MASRETEIERYITGYKDDSSILTAVLTRTRGRISESIRSFAEGTRDKLDLTVWTLKGLDRFSWGYLAGFVTLAGSLGVYVATGWPIEKGSKISDLYTGEKSSVYYSDFKGTPTPSPIPTVELRPFSPTSRLLP